MSSYPPSRARLSEFGYRLVRELDAVDGIGEVLVLADESNPKIERFGEKTTIFRAWRPDNPLSIFLLIFKLLRLRPDVVHFSVNFFSMGNGRIANLVGLCLIPICRVLGFRVVTTFHYFGTGTNLEEFGLKNSYLNRLGLILGKFLATRAHITVSLVKNLLGRPRNILFVPHGAVNPSANCACSNSCSNNSTVLFFGFLSPNKGVEYLIDAFQRMNDPNLKLIITDSPHPRFRGYSQKLRRMADGNGNIVFVNYVPEGELPSFFSQGDIVVFPYTSCVGTSGAFHTAAGFGKATVMADLPVFRELMEQGAGGLVFPPRDVDALVGCLKRLLSNPSLVKDIENKNLRFSRSRTWSEVARQYFQVYMKCFGKGLAGFRESINRFIGSANRLLLLAVALAFVFHLALTSTGAYKWSYDAYTHMFFADHYARSWFSLWEPRWFGGFYVTTYPPLVHQSLALLSLALGMEIAYQALSLVLMILIPVAVYSFARMFVSDESAGYASLLSVFLPSIGETAYFSGQLTTLFGLVSSLFASVCLYSFLESGKMVDLALTVSSLGVSVSSHHFSALFFLPLSLLLSLVMVILKPFSGVNWRKIVFRLILISVVGGLVCLTVVYPFWAFLLDTEMQTPIYHGSREVFSEAGRADLFFWNMYGAFLVFIPLTCVFALKNMRLVPLLLAGLFMFLMGLGGTTPLPLVLGKWWEWLVYDRFALWAGVLLLPISGLICRLARDRLTKFSLDKLLLVVLLVSLAANCWWVSSLAVYFGHPEEVRLEQVKAFLDGDGRWRWRYLTLGFGEAQLARLSMMVNATTLDGVYYTGRMLPVLRDSGLGIIDASKYYYEIMGEGGLALLNNVLSDASSYGLKWVFCSDPFYQPILEAHGFAKLCTLTDGATEVWYREGVPMLQLSEFERSAVSVASLVWGIAPMTCLLFAISLVFYKRWFKRKTVDRY